MCYKEFDGYTCGHCSIPIVRPCPIAAQHPDYPICTNPALKPRYANSMCHACSRVVWNQQVLSIEREHRDLHLQGMCQCHVVFDDEREIDNDNSEKDTDYEKTESSTSTSSGHERNMYEKYMSRESDSHIYHMAVFDPPKLGFLGPPMIWHPPEDIAADEQQYSGVSSETHTFRKARWDNPVWYAASDISGFVHDLYSEDQDSPRSERSITMSEPPIVANRKDDSDSDVEIIVSPANIRR